MKKEELRSVSFPNSGAPAKFHMWLIKEDATVYADGKTDMTQHAFALVEISGGQMKEIKATDITFLD